MTLKLRVEPVGIANALSAQRHAFAQRETVRRCRGRKTAQNSAAQHEREAVPGEENGAELSSAARLHAAVLSLELFFFPRHRGAPSNSAAQHDFMLRC
jgi:hypothetical protein